MAHRCKFCSATFRKSDYRRQHENAVHRAEIEERERSARNAARAIENARWLAAALRVPEA
jgi:hypothetical protein